MLHILTLKIKEKYPALYVNRLYNSIKRNSTIDFKMYCYTEDPTDIIPEVEIIPIDIDPDKYQLQWHKLIFHNEGFAGIPKGEQCMILDIDWVIIGDMDPILSWSLKEGEFGCIQRWWSRRQNWCYINGGFQIFNMGDTSHLWDIFTEKPDHWMDYYISIGEAEGPVNGEQNFIDKHVEIKRSYLPNEWFCKYDVDDYHKLQKQWMKYVDSTSIFYIDNEFDERIKMVHFSNYLNQQHKHDDPWIKTYWK